MMPETVLSHPARVLTQEQRESYFRNGYVAVESLFGAREVDRIRAVVDEFVQKSRAETRSGNVFDLAPGHSAGVPRLRRLRRPHEQHELFWEVTTGVLADVAADLVGPDVVFHHSKLNFKWNDGNDEVAWHQDIQFYPHTNYSPLTIGLLLQDTAVEDGAVGFLPGSHDGQLYNQYDDAGQWAGCLNARDVEMLDLGSAVYVEGAGGVHHRAQLPHRARLAAEHPRGRASAAAERLCIGGCVPLHPESGAHPADREDHPRQARALGAPRSAPVPRAARLVRRLHVHLRGAGRRGGVRVRAGRRHGLSGGGGGVRGAPGGPAAGFAGWIGRRRSPTSGVRYPCFKAVEVGAARPAAVVVHLVPDVAGHPGPDALEDLVGDVDAERFGGSHPGPPGWFRTGCMV